jgi:hypothetical protein
VSKDILLFTKDIQKTKKEIKKLGGRITHILSKKVLVAQLPYTVDVKALKMSELRPPKKLDSASKAAMDAWKAKQKKEKLIKPSEHEGKAWDTPGYKAP